MDGIPVIMAHVDHCKQLLDKLNKQREAGFLCDCTVFIGKLQFKAHRNVLASFSEYFNALFMDALDNIVLDGKQVTASVFQTLLDFIYSGDLQYERCNIKEILLAAEHLKLEEVVSLCKIRLESGGMVKLGIPEVPFTAVALDSNQQSSLIQSGDDTVVEKPEPACLQVEAKKMITIKKTNRSKRWKKVIRSYQKVQKKSVQHQNPSSVNPSDFHEDTKSLAESLTEQDSLDHGSCLLQLTSALECETYLPQDIAIQPAHGKQKAVKAQQSCALKEHQIANIASVRNMCKMESLEKDLNQTYSKNKPACNTCGKVFSEASSLRRHMRIHKGVKPYVCQLCGKAFTQCNQLKTHVRTHTGEKPYQCKLCDKGFAQKCQLVFHSRMHHGEEKPYKCDACNLQFATSSNLKIHSRKHSGEKPYVCDRCGQRFAQASTLTYHVRRHTGEKPYVCDTCGKAFAVSSSLITHARKHTGEKPYICGVCGKSFISSGELNKHFRSHTGERPFVCELCGNSYTDVKNLKKHKLKMHSESEETVETDALDSTFNSEDLTKKSPVEDSMDLKPSELFLPLTLHIGPEDHQMLLPVSDSQSLTSENMLRTSATNYSEPQYIYLQQMY
ncbi:myoneurin [Pelobates cultripes]|uniref:Myoneurin n=1 Tax=Pelobates cultripes TaxID=61616 RepID=A0AAD1RC93_PELCU|nr:myoneurin [Pelobates cultripes]